MKRSKDLSYPRITPLWSMSSTDLVISGQANWSKHLREFLRYFVPEAQESKPLIEEEKVTMLPWLLVCAHLLHQLNCRTKGVFVAFHHLGTTFLPTAIRQIMSVFVFFDSHVKMHLYVWVSCFFLSCRVANTMNYVWAKIKVLSFFFASFIFCPNLSTIDWEIILHNEKNRKTLNSWR